MFLECTVQGVLSLSPQMKFSSVTILMKSFHEYIPVVLSVKRQGVVLVLPFKSKLFNSTLMCTIPYQLVLTYEFVDKKLKTFGLCLLSWDCILTSIVQKSSNLIFFFYFSGDKSYSP